ncbi:MAG: flagellar protein FliT [Pseudomonadota bacterium]
MNAIPMDLSDQTPEQKKLLDERMSPTERLAGILEMTRSMVELAANHEWEHVQTLEQQRRVELQRCFADPIKQEHSELVAEALAVLLHLNKELMDQLAAARDTVLEQSAQQARTRAALGKYQQVLDS